VLVNPLSLVTPGILRRMFESSTPPRDGGRGVPQRTASEGGAGE
jgi:hypothetical protein